MNNIKEKKCCCGGKYPTLKNHTVKECWTDCQPASINNIERIVEEFESDLESPHTDVGLLLNSVLGFPAKGETAGSMKTKLIPHISKALRKSLANLIQSQIEAIEGERQDLPKSPCINAESHLFGSCFQCEKIKGHNAALDTAITILKGYTGGGV